MLYSRAHDQCLHEQDGSPNESRTGRKVKPAADCSTWGSAGRHSRMKNLRLHPVRVCFSNPNKIPHKGVSFQKMGKGWVKISEQRIKGLTVNRLTPLFYWLPGADSNHGPDG
jgi:hypothetical protein